MQVSISTRVSAYFKLFLSTTFIVFAYKFYNLNSKCKCLETLLRQQEKKQVETLHIRIIKEKIEQENGTKRKLLILNKKKKKETFKMGNVFFFCFFYANGNINSKVSSRTDGGYSVIERYKCPVVTLEAITFQLKCM